MRLARQVVAVACNRKARCLLFDHVIAVRDNILRGSCRLDIGKERRMRTGTGDEDK